jgi:hypothetical protein
MRKKLTYCDVPVPQKDQKFKESFILGGFSEAFLVGASGTKWAYCPHCSYCSIWNQTATNMA